MENVSTVGLDLAKHMFQAYGASQEGAVVFRKKLRRQQVLQLSELFRDAPWRRRHAPAVVTGRRNSPNLDTPSS